MQVLRSIEELTQIPGPVALAIGVFDGLHLGHQEVIQAAQEHAIRHHGTAAVMTFDPHPLRVLRPEKAPQLLAGARYQNLLLERMGISWSLLCPFTQETASTSAECFVTALVQACQPLGCVSVGYTWAFGKGRGGNIHSLMDWGQRHDFAVYGVPPIKVEGQVVSSTLIRDAVSVGDLQRASQLLGRPYALFGTVQEGRKLARTLGFPTANLRPDAELLPPFGVYAVRAEINGVRIPGVANLGVRPTVESAGVPLLEVHFFDYAGDLYHQDLEVELVSFLRPETKFAGIEALKAQIVIDALEAKAVLAV